MDIIVSGYGKMGKIVECEALKRGDRVVARIDSAEDWAKLDFEALKRQAASCERDCGIAAVDFSTPDVVLNNIRICFENDIPIVVGTTGWYSHIESLKKECKEKNRSMFWASNFSIGVFLFNKLNVMLAKMMSSYPQYEPSIREIHHIHKKDAPSGTAISLAESLIANYPEKKSWELSPERTDKEVLRVEAERVGEVFGTHIIDYQSEIDKIEIKLGAFSRHGFASGAVIAAHWLKNRRGFFTMSDMLD